MAASKQTVIVVTAAGFALAALSFVELVSEVMPYFVGGVSTSQRFAAIVSGDFRPADSRWSRDLFLADCLNVTGSIYAMAQSPARRKALLDNCGAQAAAVAASVPTASNAWLVMAVTASESGDFDTMGVALSKSASSAPGLQWLADRRSKLAESHLAQLGAGSRATYESDLRVLAAGRVGVDVLAQRYVRREDLGDAITKAVETASAAQQKLFVERVKFHTEAELRP